MFSNNYYGESLLLQVGLGPLTLGLRAGALTTKLILDVCLKMSFVQVMFVLLCYNTLIMVQLKNVSGSQSSVH